MTETNQTQQQMDSRSRVLIIEDDRDLNNLLKFTLESTKDYTVFSQFDGEKALACIHEFKPHIILLDVMLPHTEGTEVLRQLRRTPELAATPVILLTAKSQESDKIDGFEAGADDYITKPFSPRELLLRVQALLRRTGFHSSVSHPVSLTPTSEKNTDSSTTGEGSNSTTDNEKVIRIGILTILPDQFKVLVNDEPVALTATEYQLLIYLAERAGRLQSRDALLQRVWGYEGQLNTRTVDTHVKRLRQKLGEAGSLIETVHGFGYQLIDKLQKPTKA
ncbi:MAG: response regulator transcription factor [Silvanigrellaceae bacterium]